MIESAMFGRSQEMMVLFVEDDMNTQRIKVSLLLIPTFIVLGFEYLRHTYCIPYVSLETGNWMIAGLTALSISLISQRLFYRFEQAERSLSAEREIRAVLEERERLARELHDRIAQSIFYMGVKIESLRKTNAEKPIESSEWDEVLLALREMDENIRQAIFNLRQDNTASLDFGERMERYLANAFCDTEVHWTVNLECDPSFLETTEQIQLFGILQEAVTNIRKHASASRVSVTLSKTSSGDRTWTFQVCDNGIGFNPQERRRNQYGLDIIMNRARDIGATALIESSGQGTCIRITKNRNS
jgi:signal transduction histidine kinase